MPLRQPVAIIGIDGRFACAESAAALWQLLRSGKHGIRAQTRWNPALCDPEMVAPGTMASDALGESPAVDRFDHELFGISPVDAAWIDPQQRLLLEVGWRALELSGRKPSALAGQRVGVWIAAGASDYRTLSWQTPERFPARAAVATSLSMLAHRLSAQFDLRGPSTVVNAGCSSVPAAVSEACRALDDADVDLALVCGSNLVLDPRGSIALSQGWVLSARGECRPFDAAADGYVRGDGVAVAVLCRLQDAQQRDDPVLAVIRASVVRHGGRQHLSRSLADVIREGLHAAELRPGDIAYVDAYGVGSPAVDAAELAALADVFERVHLGSYKPNIGHLEWAGGLASIAKLCAMFEHHEVPPQLNLDNPIPLFDPDVFRSSTAIESFSGHYAIVNTVAMGGACGCMVLETPPSRPARRSDSRAPHLFAFSAPDNDRLVVSVGNWAHSGLCAADAAWTLASAREQFAVRAACVADQVEDVEARPLTRAASVVWAFTGQGSQRDCMGLQLREHSEVFADALSTAGGALENHLGMSIDRLLSHRDLSDTRYAQPATFALQYALAQTWLAWDVVPAAVLGHSVGEIAACVVAGMLSLDDAAALVAERGRLMSSLPAAGGMLAVFASLREVTGWLPPTVAIAAVNGPEHVVVSGPREAIEQLALTLDAEAIGFAELEVSHAFHSALMGPVLQQLDDLTQSMLRPRGRLPLYSTVLGRRIRRLPVSYWRRHARMRVLFSPVVETLPPETLVLEIGPSATLTQMGRRVRRDLEWAASLGDRSEWCGMLKAAAALWSAGCPVNVETIERGRGGRLVAGPGTPFAPHAHWYDRVSTSV